jgi:cis-3-alkyl-4-acyloxetan-2-one decarboxylase
MSYVDCGQGRPIVFVHGSMTWSFLFRRMIEDLQENFRCVAPDHLGFGLSEKPEDANYWPDGHARRFAMFMDYLDLRDVTLVVHDAGGPIALEWAAQNPDRVREIVVFNSWLWDLSDNLAAENLAKMIGNPLNKFYYRLLQATPAFILPPLFADRHRLPKAIQQQYLKPYHTHFDRLGVYTLVESWRKSGAYFESVKAKMGALQHKRVLLIWGTKDPLFGKPALDRFATIFPQGQILEYPGSGRFLPEEQADHATAELRWFLMNTAVSLSVINEIGH